MSDPLTSDKLLRSALRANAAFSGGCGLIALAFSAELAASLGIQEQTILSAQGASLVCFSGALVWLATRERIKPALALAVVVMDLLWVATTPVPLLLSGWLTSVGRATMVSLSAVVLVFAALQYAGLRQLRGALRSAAPTRR